MTVCSNLTDGDEYGLLSLQIASYFYIGIFRLLSFIVLFIVFYYCKKYAQRTGNLGRARFFLILPIYSDYLRFMILYCAVVGLVNVIFRNFFVNPFALSAQLGGFHFFYEGLWFFLTQYGAGSKAFIRASLFGVLSGTVSFFCFFVATQYMKHNNDDYAFSVLLSYNIVYCSMSLIPILLPQEYFYRRPAMFWYTLTQSSYYGVWIVSVIMVYFGVDVGYCVGATNYILFDGVLKPLAIFYTLSIDSQYWQGIGADDSPLAGTWEIDMSVADTLSKVGSKQGSSVPFIHFGLIELKKDMGFVAGGFSRVYFGRYKNQPIALKMLFVVDLTPEPVKEFCKEVSLLRKLKNENVIECKGVSVMPPAVSIVLEFCKHGSLFDVLYKERSSKKNFYHNSLKVLLGHEYILPGTRIFSIGSVTDSAANPLNRKSFQSDGRGSEGMSAPDVCSRSVTNSNESSGLSDNILRSSGGGKNRKSLFGGRESIFGGKAFREESKQLLYTHSQGRVGSDWDKLKRWLADNPASTLCSPIFEDEYSVSQSESSIFRWSSSQVKSPTTPPPRRRMDQKDYLRKDLPQAVMDGLPLGHSLSVMGKLEIMTDVVRGLAFMHAKGYMHCDIKSLNFLVTENFTVKIADLGEARKIVPDPDVTLDEAPIPAFSWCPPEVLDLSATSSVYTTGSDVYGLSMVLAEVITNELPLDKLMKGKKVSYDELLKILSIEKRRPVLPDNLPPMLADILKQAWDTDPAARPSAADILNVLEQCASVLDRQV